MSNLVAYILKFNQAKIRSGFYGFNGMLFGASVFYYYQTGWVLLGLVPVFVMITFLLSAVIEHYFATAFNLPGLSLPFISALYIFVIFLTNYDGIAYSSAVATYTIDIPSWLAHYFESIALILFQKDVLAGMLLAVGLLFFSRVLFVLSISGYTFSYLYLSLILPEKTESLYILNGVNALLISFAVGGSLVIPSKKSFLLAAISVLLGTIVTGFFSQVFAGSLLPVIVLPFNFITLLTIYSLKFRQEQTGLVLLYFAPGSPEENYYFHHTRRSRFDKIKYYHPELPVLGDWYISQGFDGEYTHKDKWKYAWDFVIKDDSGKEYTSDGNTPADYYCYNLPVVSVLEGTVVRVVDHVPANKIGEVNIEKNWGNAVIIDHGEGLFSASSHLEAKTIKVKEGDRVEKGDIIGNCGNSGRSPYPHLHFQFQLTNKLGESTFQYPFAHYVEKKNNELILHSFDYPQEGMHIRNLNLDRNLKENLEFRLGDKFKVFYRLHGEENTEEWEVKVSIYNSLYIESSKGSTAAIYNTNKVSYLSEYTGTKNCALYYFYLLALQVPFTNERKLVWNDTYPLFLVPGSQFRYLSEFLLMFTEFFETRASFSFLPEAETEENMVMVKNEISISGKHILRGMSRNFTGYLKIHPDEGYKSFSLYQKQKEIFHAKFLKDERKNP